MHTPIPSDVTPVIAKRIEKYAKWIAFKLHRPNDVDDISQDIWVAVIRRYRAAKRCESLAHWGRIIRLAAIDVYMMAAQQLTDDASVARVSHDYAISWPAKAACDENELLAWIREITRKLPPLQRAIALKLGYYSIPEIAAQLRISYAAARHAANKVRHFVRKKLKNLSQEP